MDPKELNDDMIDDIVKMLDGRIAEGIGHVNIEINENRAEPPSIKTRGCTDCSL